MCESNCDDAFLRSELAAGKVTQGKAGAFAHRGLDSNGQHVRNVAASVNRAGRRQSSWSMTTSAPIRINCGILNPLALAVLRLITRWSSVGCSTGISAGFAPRKILPNFRASRLRRRPGPGAQDTLCHRCRLTSQDSLACAPFRQIRGYWMNRRDSILAMVAFGTTTFSEVGEDRQGVWRQPGLRSGLIAPVVVRPRRRSRRGRRASALTPRKPRE